MLPEPSPNHDRAADSAAPLPLPATIDVSQPDQRTDEGPTGPFVPTAPAAAPTIPGYAITEEIAQGGMGKVYAGLDLALDREVAIKTLLPGANVERFVTEAKITAKLPHPFDKRVARGLRGMPQCESRPQIVASASHSHVNQTVFT